MNFQSVKGSRVMARQIQLSFQVSTILTMLNSQMKLMNGFNISNEESPLMRDK